MGNNLMQRHEAEKRLQMLASGDGVVGYETTDGQMYFADGVGYERAIGHEMRLIEEEMEEKK